MNQQDWLAARFEEKRTHLHGVAYRILGSRDEANDALQEAWMRMNRFGTEGVENLAGWMTTVVGRVCLNMLESRRARREEPLARAPAVESLANGEDRTDPEQAAVLADSVGIALLVVLDTLHPAERLAFVLHDVFDIPYNEIAPVVDRSPVATRQLASRARRRVRGAGRQPDADAVRRRKLVAAFLAASRNGDFDALLAMLDPDVALRADAAAVRMGASDHARGSRAVADVFLGRAQGAELALINGSPGALWGPHGRPRVAFAFKISHGKINEITLLADPTLLSLLDLEVLDDE